MWTWRRNPCVLALASAVLFALPVIAQEGQDQMMPEGQMSPEEAASMAAMQQAMTPGPEHAELAAQAGTYTARVTMWPGPDVPPMSAEAKAERSMILGGRVMVETFESEFMGMPFEGVTHLGYDNVTGKYWSTWADNMSTGPTLMEGTQQGEKMVFEGHTPDPTAGGKSPMRIEIYMQDGKEVHDFYQPGPDGEMRKTMAVTYEKQ